MSEEINEGWCTECPSAGLKAHKRFGNLTATCPIYLAKRDQKPTEDTRLPFAAQYKGPSPICEYEDCDQEVTVLVASKPTDDPQGMCKFHAIVSLCFHASKQDVKKALIEADKYEDILPL